MFLKQERLSVWLRLRLWTLSCHRQIYLRQKIPIHSNSSMLKNRNYNRDAGSIPAWVSCFSTFVILDSCKIHFAEVGACPATGGVRMINICHTTHYTFLILNTEFCLLYSFLRNLQFRRTLVCNNNDHYACWLDCLPSRRPRQETSAF